MYEKLCIRCCIFRTFSCNKYLHISCGNKFEISSIKSYEMFNYICYRKPRVIVATASPQKFPNATERAIGEKQHASEMKQANCKTNRISKLFHLPTKYNNSMKLGANWTKILREKIEEISKNVSD